MKTVTLGRTGITVNKNGFGALPIQRLVEDDAVRLLRQAFEAGINFFDTARFYTDSEHKIGKAFKGIREELYISTKSMALTGEEFTKQLDDSLSELQTDYVDIMQFHNPPFCPKPDGEDGLWKAMTDAVSAGKVRHIGITNHRMHVAKEAIESGIYETLQFPFSYIASPEEVELVRASERAGMGFLCMKGMAGGLIKSGRAAYAYLAQFPNALPIWGIQRQSELEEFLSCNTEDFQQTMTPELQAVIDADRKALATDFCRGCGYCMPCPQGILIKDCARMALFLQRAPIAEYTTDFWKEEMHKIEKCTGCGSCAKKCPYGLDTPNLLKENYKAFSGYF